MTYSSNSPSRIARGGKAIYGAPLGILMLEARFPRIPGDMGNGTTWPFPVLYRVVSGASPEKVVLKGADGLLPDFIDAAKGLVRLGAEAITTNCGFLSLFQKEIAAAVGVRTPDALQILRDMRNLQSRAHIFRYATMHLVLPLHRFGAENTADVLEIFPKFLDWHDACLNLCQHDRRCSSSTRISWSNQL